MDCSNRKDFGVVRSAQLAMFKLVVATQINATNSANGEALQVKQSSVSTTTTH